MTFQTFQIIVYSGTLIAGIIIAILILKIKSRGI